MVQSAQQSELRNLLKCSLIDTNNVQGTAVSLGPATGVILLKP